MNLSVLVKAFIALGCFQPEPIGPTIFMNDLVFQTHVEALQKELALAKIAEKHDSDCREAYKKMREATERDGGEK